MLLVGLPEVSPQLEGKTLTGVLLRSKAVGCRLHRGGVFLILECRLTRADLTPYRSLRILGLIFLLRLFLLLRLLLLLLLSLIGVNYRDEDRTDRTSEVRQYFRG